MEPVRFKLDRNFEECVCQALIVDHQYAEQMLEVLNTDYFNIEHLKETVKIIFSHYHKYKHFPTYKLLVTFIKAEVPDGILKEQMIGYLLKIKKEPLTDMDYIKESSLDFCRKRSLALALEASLSLIEEKKYDQIALEIKKALQAGSERTIGHIYKDLLELRMNRPEYSAVATPWDEINKVTKGGLGKGKLGVIAACTGVGKSHALVDIGAHAIVQGLSVIHYTLELDEIDIGARYDARISGINIDNLKDNELFVKKTLETNIKGNLIIKSYPVRKATVNTLKNHVNSVLLRGIVPDLILIDYADLMQSSESFSKDAKRLNEEAIYEELRSWAREINIPVWTVTQINRDGMDVEVITLKYVAECFAKAMIADLFMTMSRKKDGPTPDIGNMFIAKSRLGRDGVKFPLMINTGISKIEILAADSIEEDDSSEEAQDELYKLKQKFKKFQKNFTANGSDNN